MTCFIFYYLQFANTPSFLFHSTIFKISSFAALAARKFPSWRSRGFRESTILSLTAHWPDITFAKRRSMILTDRRLTDSYISSGDLHWRKRRPYFALPRPGYCPRLDPWCVWETPRPCTSAWRMVLSNTLFQLPTRRTTTNFDWLMILKIKDRNLIIATHCRTSFAQSRINYILSTHSIWGIHSSSENLQIEGRFYILKKRA